METQGSLGLISGIWKRNVSISAIPAGTSSFKESQAKLPRIWGSSPMPRQPGRRFIRLISGRLVPIYRRVKSTSSGMTWIAPLADLNRIQKVPGGFGKLLICLPAAHEGGSLSTRYRGVVKEFKTETSCRWSYSYVAW